VEIRSIIRRRELVRLVGSIAALWPLAARAEAGVRRVGVLLSSGDGDPEHQAGVVALRQGLGDLGWKNGENLRIDLRWGGAQPDRIRQYGQELIALSPDVIVANGTPAVIQLKPLTRTIPIVCAPVTAPVDFGFVESLARPGGNITGFSFIDPKLIGKWTALLKDAAPALKRAAVLYNPKINPWYSGLLRVIAVKPELAALEVVPAPVETADELAAAVENQGEAPGGALIIGPEAFVIGHVKAVIRLATAKRLPGISVYREFVAEGGLMSYGPDLTDIFRQAAGYVDRILKGASPATLPVQEPTKFQLAINQKTAAALGLALSPTLLAGADDVIE
jgi:putative tryptophan/tyrosine transport system substrate-binding protein